MSELPEMPRDRFGLSLIENHIMRDFTGNRVLFCVAMLHLPTV